MEEGSAGVYLTLVRVLIHIVGPAEVVGAPEAEEEGRGRGIGEGDHFAKTN